MMQYGAAVLSGAVVGLWHDGTALPMAGVIAVCSLGACLLRQQLLRSHAA